MQPSKNQGIHTQLLGKELAGIIPADYEVFYDHGELEGRIVAYYGRLSRITQLSFVDIAVVSKIRREVAILCEVEERIPTPKKILGDLVSLLLAEKIRYKNLDYAVRAPYLIFGFKVKERGRKADQALNLIKRFESVLNVSLNRVKIVTCEDLDTLRETLKKEFLQILK